MHIPSYWARGTAKAGRLFTQATGWSDRSVVEACDAARTRAERVLLALAEGQELSHYEYGTREPLREEVIQRHGVRGAADEMIVTRNRYGSLVLNTPNVLFADVDDPKPKRVGIIAWILGARREPVPEASTLRQRLESAAAQSGLHCAVYRTKAGFRLLVLNRLYDPASDETQALLAALGSDPLYMRLTRSQKSFRARLTPKPWRCGLTKPPYEFPRETERPELAHAKWLSHYNVTSAEYATCEFLGEVGSGTEVPQAVAVRRLHDALSISDGRPLA